jgi:RNA polymerase subunit RPABC4/transcription elongation factor Spt4
MFFLIGGVQPRTVKLDSFPRACGACGHPTLQLKRTDHYLSLFFIPLFRVKRGASYMDCERCRAVYPEDASLTRPEFSLPSAKCPMCGRAVQPDFKLCPYCGQSLKSS